MTTRRSPADGASNTELVTRCIQGDATAWEQLVLRYERLVYSIPLKEGMSKGEAAEVAQETFAALVKDLDRIRDPERLAYWLMTATRRQIWRMRAADNDQPSPAEDSVEQDWEDRHAEIAWLYDALESLGEPCRTVLQLLYFDPESPSYAEIAVAIGRPVGSIGPVRARCLTRMRELMEADLADLGEADA